MIQFTNGKWRVHYERKTYDLPTLTLAQALMRRLIADYYQRQALTISANKAHR